MKVSEDKHYEYLSSQCRYLNEKIIQSYLLFIKLASSLIGGVFYLHWKLKAGDFKRGSLAIATDALFVLISISIGSLIWNNLRSWRKYRETLSEHFEIKPIPGGVQWCANEIVMLVTIGISLAAFLLFNPLYNTPLWKLERHSFLQVIVITLTLIGGFMLAFGYQVIEGISRNLRKELETEKKGLIAVSDIKRRPWLFYGGLVLLFLAAVLQVLMVATTS